MQATLPRSSLSGIRIGFEMSKLNQFSILATPPAGQGACDVLVLAMEWLTSECACCAQFVAAVACTATCACMRGG